MSHDTMTPPSQPYMNGDHVALFTILTQGIVYQEANGGILAANPAAERILGLTIDQMQGRAPRDPRWRAIHEDGAPLTGETHPASVALRTGRTERDVIMGVFHPAENAYRWVRITAIPQFHAGDPAPFAVYCIFDDITAHRSTAEALDATHTELRTLLESVTDAIFSLDTSWRFTYVNEEAERLLQHTSADLLGLPIWRVFPEQPGGAFGRAFQQARVTQRPLAIEAEYTPLNAWFEARAYPSPTGVTVFFTDITARRRVDEALRESERRFRAIFEQAPIGVALITLDGAWMQVNQRLCAMLGYQREELLRLTLRQITDPDDPDLSPLAALASGECVDYTDEKRFMRQDGSLLWGRMHISVTRDDDDCVRFLTVMIEDITEQKQAETALRHSEHNLLAQTHELESIFETVTDGLFVYNGAGDLLRVNHAGQVLLGSGETMSELSGDALSERLQRYTLRDESGRPLAEDRWPVRRLLDGETLAGPTAADVVMRVSADHEGQFSVSGAPVRDAEQRIIGAVALMRDVTERRRLERRTHDTLRALLMMAEALVTTQAPGADDSAETAPVDATGEPTGEPTDTPTPDVIKRLVSLTRHVLERPHVAIATLNPGTGELRLVGDAESDHDETQTHWHFVSTTLDELFTSSQRERLTAGENVALAATAARPQGALAIPLRIHERLIGVLWLTRNTAQPGGAGEEHAELALALAVAQLAALVIEREQLAREHESVLRSFYESAPMMLGIVETNEDALTMVSCNTQAARQLFERIPEAISGRLASDLGMPTEALRLWREQCQQAMTSRAPARFEYERSVAGQQRWFSATISHIQTSPTPYPRFAFVIDDTTTLKQHEEELRRLSIVALEASRQKSEFLANMSHELRTPMSGVISMSELLLTTPLAEEQRDYTRIIHHSAQALLNILNEILDFSKIEAGKLILEYAPFDPRALVEDVAELFASRAHEQGIELMTFVDPLVPPLLSGDAGRLRQTLLNLVGNAIKFTAQGEVVVRMTLAEPTGEELAGHITVRLEVHDTGIGLSAEAQSRIFQPFVQADGSTSRTYGGTGLGLAICKRQIELMGGTIGVESVEGQGATFWCTAALAKAPSIKQEPDITAPCAPVGRALVVNGSAMQRDILCRYLTAWGLRADEAESGRAALDALQAAQRDGDPYQCALIDLALPDMDGFALRRVARRNQVTAGVAFLLLTAFGQAEEGAEALEAGFAAYLAKPLKRKTLTDTLERMVSRPSEQATASGERAPGAASDGALPPTTQGTTAPRLAHAPGAPETPPPTPAETKDLILLVEDNPINQRIILSQLTHCGYSAHVVSDGRAAVAALNGGGYAMALMDCQMPIMDGYEATRHVRQREAEQGGHTPIIALTAHALQGDRDRCLSAGMDDYLTKPVLLPALKETIAQWLTRPAPETASPAEASAAVAAPAPAPRAVGALDREILTNLQYEMDCDDESFAALLDSYQSEAKRAMAELQRALAAGEITTLQAVSHRLKSSSASVGATSLATLCAEIERLAEDVSGDAKAQPTPGIMAPFTTLVARATEELARVIEEFARTGWAPVALA